MDNSFLNFLVAQKLIAAADAARLAAEAGQAGKSLDELLTGNKKMSEEDLLAQKSAYYQLPPAALNNRSISPDVLDLLPKETMSNYRLAPFALDGSKLKIAMVEPQDLSAKQAVDFMARQKGWAVEYYVTTTLGLKHALAQYGNLSSEVEEALSYAADTKAEKATLQKGAPGELEEVVKSAPVSKMVNVILKHAVEGGASDIHIEPGEADTRVRYRVDGQLATTLTLPKYIHASIISRIKVLSNLKLDETRKPQDGRIHITLENRQVDLRISTMPLVGTEKVVIRILDVTRGAPTLEQLGFMGRNLALVKNNINQPNGLFLVTGPTGSGKSTTLFAALSILNKEHVNIVTLEDPVEYYLPGANQSQVRPEVGYTFATGLRSILRQDPDIIMVGEIRDGETAELAVQAALTGHIVLSTLHTNNALGAIPRLIDMKVEPFLLANTINMLASQRLVRKICEHCRQESAPPANLAKKLQAIISSVPPGAWYPGLDPKRPKFYKGAGCPKCGGSGYQGRLSICEVVDNTKNMQAIIYRGYDSAKAGEELLNQGFFSMMQDGVMKVMLGLTTLEEVMLATKE